MKEINISTAFLLSAILISSCSKSGGWLQEAPVMEIDFESDIELVDIPPDSLGTPEQMLSYGQYILWSDNDLDMPLWVYNQTDGSIASPLKKGRAYNEVLNINQIVHIENGFGLSDMFKNRLTCYKMESGTSVNMSETDIKDFSAVSMVADTIIGTLKNGHSRYALCSSDGDLIKEFGDYSKYGLSNEAGWGLMQGHICANARLGRIACFSYYTGAYEIVNYRDTSVICSRILEMSTFDDNGQHYASMKPDSKVNFISATSGNEMIFTLYDGKDLKYYMENRGIGQRGNDICVFDWDGNYIIRLHSEFPLCSIAWNEDNESLYLCFLSKSGKYMIGSLKRSVLYGIRESECPGTSVKM